MKLKNSVFKSSNLYRILGTNSNAGEELIKQRYLEKVREFPPEENPEEFKVIREAYDTLKDPFKRSGYDLETKYQGQASKFLQEAVDYMDWGKIEEAEFLLNKAAELAADNLYILRLKAEVAVMKGDINLFNDIFEQLEELFPKKQEYLLLLNKIVLLLESEQYTKYANRVLKEMEKKFPDKKSEMTDVYIGVYDQQGKFNKIWNVLSNELKTFTEPDEDNIRHFLTAIALINKYEKWEKKDSLIALTESFIAKINEDQELRDYIIYVLDENYFEAEEHGDIKAQLYITELLMLFEDDPNLELEYKKLQLTEKILNEVDRMSADPKLSPYIFYTGSRLFFNWAYEELDPETFVDFPDKYAMQNFKEEYSANLQAVKRLKKKYPRMYDTFRNEWDKIAANCREQLNNRQLSLFEKQRKVDQDSDYKELASGQIVSKNKVGRNDPCPCGSGKKYKKCCLNK
ncbi:DnaJ domain-containing protein [Halanaerobium congolense]|uniref:DnaJ domain-containing protein n=1 Tax=Halanaerobium congolense TaxID=54121 RepID=A0A1G8SLD9_9FIRM|nr:DnaJ domain-containing protein [Halanaerobium congolense]SDJ30062.1 DnaJ domain-containing protein [Halanaerobium congolense]SET83416.1 DnaJ domain-containing protein [Halanaerobium congolense]